jgi:hypothetical protein
MHGAGESYPATSLRPPFSMKCSTNLLHYHTMDCATRATAKRPRSMDVAILERGPAGPRGDKRRCGCATHDVWPPGAYFKMQKLVPRGEKSMLRTFREREARFGRCDGPGTLKHTRRAPEPFSARCALTPSISASDGHVPRESVRAHTRKLGSEHRILALMRIPGHCRPYHSQRGFPIHHDSTPRCARHGA